MNTGKIFLVNQGGQSLTPLTESGYEKEAHLQAFLAQYPDLIPGDQIADPPCRWLLISREMSISDGEASGRWSLDHLFVDQDAIPTFIECKRSSDTRSRREVVAQMLDYAANGVAYWTTDEIRETAAKSCKAANTTVEQALERLLALDGSGSPAEEIENFWKRLADNLQGRRIRLIFVADEIPRELKKLVEFLNEELTNVEVLAVEVKQYLEPGGLHTVLVPAVIGATQRAQAAKQGAAKNKTTPELFLGRCPALAKRFFEELFTRAEDNGAAVVWGTVGCSVRLRDGQGKLRTLAYCYPPDDFSFNLDATVVANERQRDALRQQLLATGQVKEAGRFTLRGAITNASAERLLTEFENVVNTLKEVYQ